MQHPTIVNANASERLNQMIRDAEAHRQVKRVAVQQPRQKLFYELKERIPVLKGLGLDKSADSPA